MDSQTIIYLVIAGLLAGTSGGFLGIGGGTLFIPLFLMVAQKFNYPPSFDMHFAITTSLALIIPTAVSSSIAQYRNKNIDIAFCKKWLPWICVGSFTGGLLVHVCSAFFLKTFFVAYLLFCIIYSFIIKGTADDTSTVPKIKCLPIFSFSVGCLSAMLGTGGGTFTTPILRFFNYPLKRSIAISSVSGFFIGIIGAAILIFGSYSIPSLTDHFIGYFNWLLFLIISPTTMLGSYLGVFLASKTPQQTVKAVYILFLCQAFGTMSYHTFF